MRQYVRKVDRKQPGVLSRIIPSRRAKTFPKRCRRSCPEHAQSRLGRRKFSSASAPALLNDLRPFEDDHAMIILVIIFEAMSIFEAV
jgi:hypothetical protein